MDYYSILGVPKDASNDQIRKAYKKKSMQYHPDRPSGDEEQFKKINEAYSTLSDSHKRAMYDHQQTAGKGGFNFNSSHFRGHNPFEDIFEGAFGGFGRQQARPRTRNTDIRIRAKISLEEVLTGKKIIAAYRLRNGREETVNLDIPPGARDGDTIRFSGLGDNSVPQMPRGDLYVVINVSNKPGWFRNETDLRTNIKVNCLEMIVGAKIVVNTLEGRNLELTIPPGTKNGTTFSVNNYGLPDLHTGIRGKLLLTIDADIPKNLDEQSLNKIKEILNETS